MSTRAVLYSRAGCQLCDIMADQLEPWLRKRKLSLITVDIDMDPELKKRFGLRIPVFELDGEIVCEGRTDEETLRDVFQIR